MALPKSNTSGYKGVCWNKAVSKWTAQISCGGKQINLGCYINKDDAIAAVRKAREELHGEFARHD
jgi:hypothetical protein